MSEEFHLKLFKIKKKMAESPLQRMF